MNNNAHGQARPFFDSWDFCLHSSDFPKVGFHIGEIGKRGRTGEYHFLPSDWREYYFTHTLKPDIRKLKRKYVLKITF